MKPEEEFHSTQALKWREIPGIKGAYEKILSFNEETGDHTRILFLEPGTRLEGRSKHDFCEEVYILDGEITDETLGKTFTKGFYCCRNPGMEHGPFFTQYGLTALENRYYDLEPRERLYLVSHEDGKQEYLKHKITNLLICGFTGRNRKLIEQHIEELKKKGIKVPTEIPFVLKVPYHILVSKTEIETASDETSGEVEYVVLTDESGKLYIGVGSDHTDRKLESENLKASKAVCEKLVGKTVWLYDEIKDHWDEIEMKSYVRRGGKELLYQREKLKQLCSPEELVSDIKNIKKHGTVAFMGTVPLLEPERGFVYGDSFRVELSDPVLKRSITHEYSIKVVKT